ncbi:MAG: TonB family protein [Bacteroidota bacterium]
MKTKHVESLEEIIFENRNKEYGAYSLRKNYMNHVLVAIFIAVLFVGSALTYPLVMSPDQVVPIKGDTIVISVEPFNKIEDEPLKLVPPPPSEPVSHAEDLAYKVPIVTDEPIETANTLIPENTGVSDPIPVTTPGDFNDPEPVKSEPVLPPAEKPEPVMIVQEMPTFPGGDIAMKNFLQKHMKYPAEARELNIQGTVYLRFIVETDGSISDITVLRPIGGGCEEEAVRVVKSMPNWNPGKQNNRAVRVRLSLPVKFVLHD